MYAVYYNCLVLIFNINYLHVYVMNPSGANYMYVSQSLVRKEEEQDISPSQRKMLVLKNTIRCKIVSLVKCAIYMYMLKMYMF